MVLPDPPDTDELIQSVTDYYAKQGIHIDIGDSTAVVRWEVPVVPTEYRPSAWQKMLSRFRSPRHD